MHIQTIPLYYLWMHSSLLIHITHHTEPLDMVNTPLCKTQEETHQGIESPIDAVLLTFSLFANWLRLPIHTGLASMALKLLALSNLAGSEVQREEVRKWIMMA